MFCVRMMKFVNIFNKFNYLDTLYFNHLVLYIYFDIFLDL